MKSLDEVIKALRCTDPEVDPETKCNDCPYKEFRISDLWYVGPSCLDVMFADALHYLKHLQEYYNMSREHHEPNPALTWDELKQMFHRPVWIETTAKKGWNIIVSIDSADMQVIHTAHRGPKLSGFSKADLGKTWQAYRKERP